MSIFSDVSRRKHGRARHAEQEVAEGTATPFRLSENSRVSMPLKWVIPAAGLIYGVAAGIFHFEMLLERHETDIGLIQDRLTKIEQAEHDNSQRVLQKLDRISSRLGQAAAPTGPLSMADAPYQGP